LKRAAVL